MHCNNFVCVNSSYGCAKVLMCPSILCIMLGESQLGTGQACAILCLFLLIVQLRWLVDCANENAHTSETHLLICMCAWVCRFVYIHTYTYIDTYLSTILALWVIRLLFWHSVDGAKFDSTYIVMILFEQLMLLETSWVYKIIIHFC